MSQRFTDLQAQAESLLVRIQTAESHVLPLISSAENLVASRILRKEARRKTLLAVARRDRNVDGCSRRRAASAHPEMEYDTASAGHLAYRSPRLLLSFWSGRFGWEEPPFAKDATTKLSVRPLELVATARQPVRAAWEYRPP